MAYKDKIQKIAEDKKTKDRIEYFSKNKPGFSGSKKDKEEMINKFSKLTGIAKGSDKEDKESAKRMVDYLQTIGAKKRTATEGSFAKGGIVKSGKPKIAKKGWR